jgi:EAL domain-containing protein (putative c-di-GMP-specific phosphodiesterase class I)
MLGAVLALARAAELEATAEGIETTSQLEAVRELGCESGQGFLLAVPATAEEIGDWLASSRR